MELKKQFDILKEKYEDLNSIISGLKQSNIANGNSGVIEKLSVASSDLFSRLEQIENNILHSELPANEKITNALQINEKLFRQLFENSHDAIFLISARSRIVYASPSSSNLLGYDIQELIDNPNGLSYVHPDFREYIHSKFSEVLTKPNIATKMVYRALHKDGSYRWIENVARNLLHDPDINAVVVNSKDVTEAKESQLALEEREKWFRKLIENSNEAIAVWKHSGEAFYFSENVKDILGYSAQELLQNGLSSKIIHPDDWIELERELVSFKDTPESVKAFVYRVQHKNGSWIWIENIYRNLIDDPVVRGIVNNFRDITQRKNAEEALKQSESRYRMLMEQASDGILLYDAAGRFIMVNDKVTQMLGFNQEELKGLTLNDIFPEEDRRQQPFKFAQLNEGISVLTERLMQRKDGSVFQVEISSKKLNENSYQSFIRDITERKKTEAIIKRSEAELNALFIALPDLIIVFDKEGRLLKISSNIVGLKYPLNNEVIGKSLYEVFPQQDADFIFDQIRRITERGDATVNGEFCPEIQGEKVWFSVTASPMPFDKVVWVARDISIRKKTEIELLHSKNYLNKIINTIPEPVFVKDQNHKWILLNDAFCEYLGLPRNFLLGKSDGDFFPKDKTDALLEKDRRVLETGLDDIMEEELADARGFIHTIIIKKSLYHDPQRGKLLVGIINDITARKKIEQKLQNQNEELTKINAELDKFVYRASHDLRAPLVSILGLINIAKMENKPEKNDEYFALMEKSINKLDNFIQSIIHYSRNARLELQIEKVDFNDLISETFDDLKYIESSKNIDIRLQINESSDFYSDIFRLRIIFNNLIANAIRYYNPRKEQPYLLIKIDSDENHAVIQFEDNGIGISEESVGRIFEMFYRASETNVGSGLGLYIVKDVVDTMKGKVNVISKLGVGTTFIFDLPNYKNKQLN